MSEKIWLSSPHMGGEEQVYINQAFESNWIAPLGPNVLGFEKDICAYSGIDHCSVTISGTSAIHLALINLGIVEGDEVLVSSFTFSATVNPIVYQKATPVFVDSEEDTWNMSPKLLEVAIKDRIAKGTKPKAILLVHLYGMPAKMYELMAISNKYDIPIIEDAAEALGSSIDGKMMGTFCEMGIYSFNGNKIITTSGGGALISNNKKHCENAIFLSTQARDEAPHYQHSKIGYNYRMSNVLAGIGRGQMKVLTERVKQRRGNFSLYKQELEELNFCFQEELEGYYSNYWLTCILTESYVQREKIREVLNEHNIESRPLWKPMHKQPVFEKYPCYTNGVSESLFDIGLCLPSGSNLRKEDINKVISIIKNVIKNH